MEALPAENEDDEEFDGGDEDETDESSDEDDPHGVAGSIGWMSGHTDPKSQTSLLSLEHQEEDQANRPWQLRRKKKKKHKGKKKKSETIMSAASSQQTTTLAAVGGGGGDGGGHRNSNTREREEEEELALQPKDSPDHTWTTGQLLQFWTEQSLARPSERIPEAAEEMEKLEEWLGDLDLGGGRKGKGKRRKTVQGKGTRFGPRRGGKGRLQDDELPENPICSIRCTAVDLEQERQARYRDWVDVNNEWVRRISDGAIGYFHIPDMEAQRGLSEFVRYFMVELSRSSGMVMLCIFFSFLLLSLALSPPDVKMHSVG